MKKLIIDLDSTITLGDTNDYKNVSPNLALIAQMHEYKKQGFGLVINTARNMRTHKGNVGKINVHTLPIILKWLEEHDVPYDEVLVGKPWCGHEGFYIDDRAVRPSEFTRMSFEEITAMLKAEKEEINKTCS